MEELFGITGATGAVGGRVADRLAGLGARQRLMVRDPSKASQIEGAEIGRIEDYGDAESFRTAVDGVTTLFLVSAGEHPDRVRLHVTAVDAAIDGGVQRIVYLSFLGAAPDTTFTFARDHYATEEHIRASQVPFTFLRSSMYLDFLPMMCSPEGVIQGPAGDGRFAPVARDDVADVVVAVLTSRAHDGRLYDSTGPQRITMQQVADQLAVVTGRPIDYREETLEEARASRAPTGAPDWEIEGWVTSYAAIATGELDVVSDTVPRLTGHEAMSLPEYLARDPDSYAHIG